MARPDPRQGSFLEALVAPLPAPDPVLETEIRQHLIDMVGPGVPSCVERVHSVWLEDGAIVADIEVFDGHVHRISVCGTRETIRVYSWSHMTVPLGWDSKTKRWRRYPKHFDRWNA